MTTTAVLGNFYVVICVVSAIYAAVSRDMLRASIAFFIELASVGGVLLSLNADYLALIVFAVGLMGTLIVISFSSVIMGSLKESFHTERWGATGRTRLVSFLAMLLGMAVGGAVGWALITGPFVAAEAAAGGEADVLVIGRMMLGDHVAVFELLGITILVVVVGAGLLLRKPDNAN